MSGQYTPERLASMQSSIDASVVPHAAVGQSRRNHLASISALLLLCASGPALAQKSPITAAPQVVRPHAPAPAAAQATAQPTSARSAAALPAILEMLDDALTGLVAETSGCVVTIEGRPPRMRQHPQTGGDRSPDGHSPGSPFNPGMERDRKSGRANGWPNSYRPVPTEITGSGFLTEGGYVVTTAEVAEQMIDPVVVMPDGRHIRVDGMNADWQSNVAILRIVTLDSMAGLRWGDSEIVRPGCLAITIGNQAGFATSAGLGMVAATHRAAVSGNRRYHNLIQFQGAISGGSSGGPLLSSRGEVVGMIIAMPASGPFDQPNGRMKPANDRSFGASDALHSDPPHPAPGDKERIKEQGHDNSQAKKPLASGANTHDQGQKGADPNQQRNERSEPEKINALEPQPMRTTVIMISSASSTGFALPANDIHRIVEALKAGVKNFPKRGWLGLRPAEGSPEGSGVVVGTVWIGGPADRAGVQPGDILLELQDSAIHSWSDVRPLFGGLQEGQTLPGKVRRGEQVITVKLAITARPDGEAIKRMKTKQLPPRVGTSEQHASIGG